MRIALVDDIASQRQSLRKQIKTLLIRYCLEAEIFEFDNGETFLSAARREAFSLVFLDIYMEGKDGVETARELRTFDGDCILVFTTTSTDHALDGFRVKALQYLVKPYSDKALGEVFEEMLKRLPTPDKYIEVRISREMTRIRLKDLIYAEHYQHQIYIYTTKGTLVTARMNFKDFFVLLSEERHFFLCSRGVVVNLDYVDDYDGSEFLLKDGRRLAVSRKFSQEARKAFGDYLFHGGRSL